MDLTETTRICRLVEASVPAQAFTDETPVAWSAILRDIPFEDARTAVINVARVSRWIAPADIIAEVRRIRAARSDSAGPVDVPGDPDDVGQWLAELRRLRKAAGDGTTGHDGSRRHLDHTQGSGPRSLEGNSER